VVSSDLFDRWLDQQFQGQAGKQSGPSPMPAQARYHSAYLLGLGGAHVSILAKAGLLVSTKGAIGLAVAALALGAAGAEAAITGSVNPTNWGQQVVIQVDTCKDALLPGTHGIGECVSKFANQHGKQGNQVSSDHRASPARENKPGAPTDHPTGRPTDHPTGRPTDHPTGHPTGPPTTHPGGKSTSAHDK
jgi:hypothetical protein